VIALYEVEDLSVAKPVQDRLIEVFGRAGRLTWVVASTTLAERLHEWVTTTEQLSPGFASWAKQQKSLAIHPKIVSKLESNGFVAPKLIGAGVEGILGGLE
jgi:hypothetical protein